MPDPAFRLDFDYSAPYEFFAYSCLRKDDFLRDAHKLLKETSAVLAGRGLRQLDLHVNRGGVAVSGDAIARFAVDDTHCVEVFVGASVVGERRPDRITIMARLSEYCSEGHKKDQMRVTKMGRNVWLDPDASARELAEKLLDVAAEAGYDLRSNVILNGQPDMSMAFGWDLALTRPRQPDPVQLSLFA